MSVLEDLRKEFNSAKTADYYDPNKYRVDVESEQYDSIVEKSMNKLRGLLDMVTSEYEYSYGKKIYTNSRDLDVINEFDSMTYDFVENFINGKEGYVPSMYLAMQILSATDAGAKALGFIDINDKICYDNYNAHGYDALLYCICASELPIDTILKLISNKFDVDYDYLNDHILGIDLSDVIIPMDDFVDRPYTDVLYLTLMLGMPIQSLFNYNFYKMCDKYYGIIK